jgi:hypothetical protein
MEKERRDEAENEKLREGQEKLNLLESLRAKEKKENVPGSEADKGKKPHSQRWKLLIEDSAPPANSGSAATEDQPPPK